MPRPRKNRYIEKRPRVSHYGPLDGPARCARTLPLEGLEALRLVDAKGMSQTMAAARMGVSRPTFSRILVSARQCVSSALLEGDSLCIDGGAYEVAGRVCEQCGVRTDCRRTI